MVKKIVFSILLAVIFLSTFAFFIEKEISQVENNFAQKVAGTLLPFIEKGDSESLKAWLEILCLERDFYSIEVELVKNDGTVEKLCRIENSGFVNDFFSLARYFHSLKQVISCRVELKNGQWANFKVERNPINLRFYFVIFCGIALFSISIFFYFEAVKGNNLLEERIKERTTMLLSGEKLQELILDNIDAGVIVSGLHGRVRGINVSAEKILGLSRESALGRNFKDLINAFDVENGKKVEFALDMLESIGGPEFSYRFNRLLLVNQKNVERFISMTLTHIVNEEASFNGWICYFRDVSQEVKIEKQFKQAQKLEAVGQMAGGIAHDFNNLLQVILGYGNLLEETLADRSDDELETLHQVLEAGQRAQNLVKKILAFSRVKSDFKAHRVDLNELVAELLKMISRLLEESIKIVFEKNLDLWNAECDPEQFEQVLINLCVNARDAMEKGGTLTISLKNAYVEIDQRINDDPIKQGPYVCCEVGDTGTGITPANMDKIFDPFFTTKQQGKGTGLGLATVFNIVKQHNGFIKVDSSVGVGTVFRMYFPANEKPAEEIDVTIQENVDLSGKGETILLAEDQEEVKKLGTKILSKNGYRVISVNNGAEAVKVFKNSPDKIDLLLFDLIMPEMSGWEAAKVILEEKRGIPLIFCSGYSEQILNDQLDYVLIEKPYKKEVLLAEVKKALKKDAKTGPTA